MHDKASNNFDKTPIFIDFTGYKDRNKLIVKSFYYFESGSTSFCVKCIMRIHRPLSAKVRSLSVKMSTVKRCIFATSSRQNVRFAMFSCYFLCIIRQSIHVLCPVFSRKVFLRGDKSSNKVWTSQSVFQGCWKLSNMATK